MKAFRKNQDGITLIEVLLTIGLIGLIGAALVRLGSTALTASDAGRQRAVATQLADEGLEAARAWRDGNASQFFSQSNDNRAYVDSGDSTTDIIDFPTTTCNPSSFSGGGCQVGSTDFYRVINFKYPNPNKAKVTTYVFWNQDGTWSKVVSSTVLTQWR